MSVCLYRVVPGRDLLRIYRLEVEEEEEDEAITYVCRRCILLRRH